MDQIKSKYFDFNKSQKSNSYLVSEYRGWNSLLVAKFDIKKGKILDSNYISSHYPELNGKQKIHH